MYNCLSSPTFVGVFVCGLVTSTTSHTQNQHRKVLSKKAETIHHLALQVQV